MYSLILLAAMTPADPHGLLFAHGPFGASCSGSRAVAAVATVTTPIRNTVHAVGVRVAERPRLAFVRATPHVASSGGCSGTRAAVGAGCVGNVVASGQYAGYRVVGNQLYAPMPQAPAAVEAEDGKVGGPFHLRVRLAMRYALSGRQLTEEQQQKLQAVLADPKKAKAVRTALENPLVLNKVADEFGRQIEAKASAGRVGAIGDGHILQMLIDNLPQIIDAILKIINALG